MTFHESYGEVQTRTLLAIKRFKVTPADWYMLEALFDTEDERFDYILRYSRERGYYNPPPWME
jgi:hypothetical protein